MPQIKFSQKQLDVLRELGNICAGNATVALSQILFKKIELQVPTIQILPIKKLPQVLENGEKSVIGIQMETLGAVHGYVLLIFSEKSAYTLVDILVGNAGSHPKFITQIGVSSIKEIGNILISSYLSTLSSLSRLPVFPSCPHFNDGPANSIIMNVFGSMNTKNASVILIETIFNEQVTSVNGKFFIAFDSKSMQLILTACEKNINFYNK